MATLGLSCKIFRGTAGSQAQTEMKNVINVTLNLNTTEADTTTRGSNGWRSTTPGLLEASIDFEMLHDPADKDYIAIKTAYFTRTPIAIFATDGNGSGLDTDAFVTSFTRDEPLAEAVKYSVTIKPTTTTGESGRAPAWVDGSSSSSSSASA